MLNSLRATFQALSPRVFPYRGFALALLAGTLGGWLFAAGNLPLPWMLGSMTACTLGALARAPIVAPGIVRPPMSMVIGVMLGAGFSPDLFGHLASWIPTILGLAVFMIACALACVTYFRRFGGLDPTTAYFSGMPGGLIEMVMLGEQRGGDGRTIALLHSARILLLVLTLPFLVQWLAGVNLGPRSRIGVSMLDAPWSAELWLVGTAIAGAALGALLRLRAAFLIGPMIVTAAVHLLGWTSFTPPREIVNLAQLVLGTTIGCSFVGTRPADILRVLVLSLGSTAILLSLTLLFAYGVSLMSPYGVIPLLLAYSPGGLAEMSLIAVALQTEAAFVAGHHVIRIFFVMSGANLAFRFLEPPAPGT
jgi:membrane AbrB-like protein